MATTRRQLRTTVEIPVVTMAELMATIGGHEQPAQVKTCSYATECARTQEMPAITDEEAA